MSISTLTLWESVVLDDQPNALWGLDTAGPTVDDSGNGNTLTAVGSPANVATLLPAGETGGATGARDFNGTTMAYTATDDPDLDLADTFTLECVAQFDVVTGTATLLSKGTNGYQLRRNTTTLELHKQGVGLIVATTGITLAASTVYHVVAAKNGASSAKIYVNGTDRSGTVTDRTCEDTATALNIARKSDSTEWLDGKLDEVAVYPYAFTGDMVTTHYAAMSAGTFGQQILGTQAGKVPRLKIEVAFSSNARDTYQRWHDVTGYARSFNASRGRNFALDRSETGRASVTLTNRARQFDPTFATGPYYPNVVLTKAIRVRAQNGTGRTWHRHRGFVDGWVMGYGRGGYEPLVQVSSSGTFKALALDKYTEPTPRPEELSGARIAEVVNVAGIVSSVETGQSLVAGVDLEQANRLEHALAVAETEGGILFEAGDGTITFQDRHHRILNESSVRQEYGDQGGAAIPFVSIDPQLDEDRLFTSASVTPASGNVQTAENTVASDRHFKRTKELSTLHATDLDAQAMANMYANKYSVTRTRIPSVTPQPEKASDAAAAWEMVLGHEISHRISTAFEPMGDASPVEREHFVEGVTESWAPGGGVSLSFSVSPAELDSEYARVGTAKVGRTSGVDNARVGW